MYSSTILAAIREHEKELVEAQDRGLKHLIKKEKDAIKRLKRNLY